MKEWFHSSYRRNHKHPENLIHKSISGNILRSKSEVLIDLSLYQHRIPYRYECELCLGDIVLYPDFTIRHPSTGELFYWEHFGMMDHPAYSHDFIKKLQIYTENGIIPTLHLITTYETQKHPLTIENVDKIITDYFM